MSEQGPSLPSAVPDSIVFKAHQTLHNQWSASKVADQRGCGDCLDDVGSIFDAVWEDIRALVEKARSTEADPA
jgi:hypothetical protein